jgi:hypothetical protein
LNGHLIKKISYLKVGGITFIFLQHDKEIKNMAEELNQIQRDIDFSFNAQTTDSVKNDFRSGGVGGGREPLMD